MLAPDAMAQDSPISLKTIGEPPEGFEDIDKPHQSLIVIQYGGKNLGLYSGMLSPGTFRFDNIDLLLDKVPALKNRNAVQVALSTDLPFNDHLICRKFKVSGCGILQPDIAGIILDPNRLQGELFVNPAYLELEDNRIPGFLPLPEQKLSSVYNINGAFNGNDANPLDFSLGATAIMAYGENRLAVQTAATDNGLFLDRAIIARDEAGYEQIGGLFRSRPMQLVSDRDLAGGSIGTSTMTRLDRRKSEGNQIALYLPRRSSVSVYREGRLYSSRYYDAGNQQIDTADLPEGAYFITLKIKDLDGIEREEQYFFAKSVELPPPDEPYWHVQGGLLRRPLQEGESLPEVSGTPLIRGGRTQRLSENIGFSTEIMGIEDQVIGEVGLFAIYPEWKLRSTLLGASDGDTGAQLSVQRFDGKLNLSMDARRLWAQHISMNTNDPVPQGLRQITGAVGYAVTQEVNVGARWSYSWQEVGNTSNESYGPNLDWNIWRSGESSLDFNADAGNNNDQFFANSFLRFTMRFGNYTLISSGGARTGQDSGMNANTRMAWTKERPGEDRLQLALDGSIEQGGGALLADADYRNKFGQVRGAIERDFLSDDRAIGYNGGFSFGMAHAENGISFGGENIGQSAVVVDTEGDANARMKVIVNGSERSIVKVGEKQAIYLAPFQSYDIRLTGEHSRLLDYDETSHKTVLYPGTVTDLRWKINNFYVVVADIVDESGNPLQSARLLKNREQVVTDDQGRMQAQISGKSSLYFKMADAEECVVNMPDIPPVNGVLIYKDSLVCKKSN